MIEDTRWCPFCGGMIEAGGGGTCTCNDEEEDERGDYLYHQRKDDELCDT